MVSKIKADFVSTLKICFHLSTCGFKYNSTTFWEMNDASNTSKAKGLDYMGFNSNKILEANNLSNTYQWKGDYYLADFYWKQGGQRKRQTQDTPSNTSQVNTVL